MKISRRDLLAAGRGMAMIAMVGLAQSSWAQSPVSGASPDLIVHNAKVTTLQDGRPEAQAFAVVGEKIVAVGGKAGVIALRARNKRVIHAGGGRGIPRPNSSPFPLVRARPDYN